MRFARALSLLAVVLLSVGCTTAPQHADLPLDTQIANLERTQEQMRKQYEAMGQTLGRLETRIAELKARAARRAEAIATLPTPAPRAAAPAAESLTSEPAAQAQPTNLVVGDLTNEDLRVLEQEAARTAPAATAPIPPVREQAAPTTPAAPRGGKSYLVHVASYLDTAPIRPGWRQISSKNPAELRGLKPYVTPFVDNQERRWLRLSVGDFTSKAAAHERCDALKAAGTWCDVLEVNTNSIRELRMSN